MVGALVGLEQAALHQRLMRRVPAVRACAIEVVNGNEYRLVVEL
jgi:hypothetical protein